MRCFDRAYFKAAGFGISLLLQTSKFLLQAFDWI